MLVEFVFVRTNAFLFKSVTLFNDPANICSEPDKPNKDDAEASNQVLPSFV